MKFLMLFRLRLIRYGVFSFIGVEGYIPFYLKNAIWPGILDSTDV